MAKHKEPLKISTKRKTTRNQPYTDRLFKPAIVPNRKDAVEDDYYCHDCRGDIRSCFCWEEDE